MFWAVEYVSQNPNIYDHDTRASGHKYTSAPLKDFKNRIPLDKSKGKFAGGLLC